MKKILRLGITFILISTIMSKPSNFIPMPPPSPKATSHSREITFLIAIQLLLGIYLGFSAIMKSSEAVFVFQLGVAVLLFVSSLGLRCQQSWGWWSAMAFPAFVVYSFFYIFIESLGHRDFVSAITQMNIPWLWFFAALIACCWLMKPRIQSQFGVSSVPLVGKLSVFVFVSSIVFLMAFKGSILMYAITIGSLLTTVLSFFLFNGYKLRIR